MITDGKTARAGSVEVRQGVPSGLPDGRARPARLRRASRRLAVAATSVSLGLAGSAGLAQYVRTYWLYRGFAPPKTPAVVYVRHNHHLQRVKVQLGTEEIVDISGAAIGERSEPAYVFLPPGYFSHPSERYPVDYLLHGVPGEPVTFFQVIDVGVAEDVLVARHRIRPMILVAPTGSPSNFTDEEWANGVRPGNDWETFVATDVVDTIDRTFRTIPSGADRAIGGLSEGGYGAINIALQHPREFRVIESWSGYMVADPVRAVWGAHPSRALLAGNSPLVEVRRVAERLRRDRDYFWFYCGRSDSLVGQNVQFAKLLRRLRLPYAFLDVAGSHTWRLWRAEADEALIVASEHFGRG